MTVSTSTSTSTSLAGRTIGSAGTATGTETRPSSVVQALQEALHGPQPTGAALGQWRWLVRRRMVAVRDALVAEVDPAREGWLAARERRVRRERTTLLARLSELGPPVLESAEVDRVRTELQRLAVDIAHHLQRVHDLAYDDVELELGGSE